MILSETVLKSVLVSLLVVGLVDSTFRVHTVREHVVAVDVTSYCWVRVAHTVCMEGWLAKVGGEGRVGEPPCGAFEVVSGRVNLNFVLGGLSTLLQGVFVDPDLPAMVVFFMKLITAHLYLL